MSPETKEAIKRLRRGEQLRFSTCIAGNLTAGYGRLDDLGFWEFPLPPVIVKLFAEEMEIDYHE